MNLMTLHLDQKSNSKLIVGQWKEIRIVILNRGKGATEAPNHGAHVGINSELLGYLSIIFMTAVKDFGFLKPNSNQEDAYAYNRALVFLHCYYLIKIKTPTYFF